MKQTDHIIKIYNCLFFGVAECTCLEECKICHLRKGETFYPFNKILLVCVFKSSFIIFHKRKFPSPVPEFS